MLVLTRRKDEKVVFPNLGISVQVVRVNGKAVRLGIDAPPDVRIARDEIESKPHAAEESKPTVTRSLRHEIRNRLNTAALGLQLLHRKMEMHDVPDAEETILKIFSELREIEGQIGPLNQPLKKDAEETRQTRVRRALIVEDNTNESELLAEFLRMSGYQVETVDDGLKAMSYLNKHENPDIVLMDMCMPRLDGPKTISSIRGEPRFDGLKLFAVSGAYRSEVDVEIGPRGVNRWFSKPINANSLINEINRELDEACLTV